METLAFIKALEADHLLRAMLADYPFGRATSTGDAG